MKQTNYQEQNKQLYLLHQERLKRKGISIQEETLPKKIQIQQKSESTSTLQDQIYLNTLIYDKRANQTKHNNITFAQLLHEDVNRFPLKPLSKDVQAIFITTYGYQGEVFVPIVKSSVPFFLVNRQGENKEGFAKKNYNGFENWTLVSPPKYNMGYGVFHTKLWLIKFKTFLRVVVCTSNHHLFDWAVWQNAFWYHDCPIITGSKAKTEEPKQSIPKTQQADDSKAYIKEFDMEKDFVETLSWVITEMQPKGFNLLNEMKIDLGDYSFKGIDVVLIPSLPGRFKGQYLDKVGIGKVKKIMKNCSIHFKKPIMTYNCTSLGKVDEKLIRQLYFAFNPNTMHFYPDKFRLVYPSQRYIQEQTCGEAHVLFLTKQNYEKCELRNHIFHRYEESSANGVLGGIPHLKTVIIEEGEDKSDRCVLYVGSHNFTRAAWGSYEKNDSQISCNNSELGLLFMNHSKGSLLKWLPYKYPPTKYSNTDRPFFKDMN